MIIVEKRELGEGNRAYTARMLGSQPIQSPAGKRESKQQFCRHLFSDLLIPSLRRPPLTLHAYYFAGIAHPHKLSGQRFQINFRERNQRGSCSSNALDEAAYSDVAIFPFVGIPHSLIASFQITNTLINSSLKE